MKTLWKTSELILMYLLAGGCYLFSELLVAKGNVAAPYVVTLLVVAIVIAFIRLSISLLDDRLDADVNTIERRRERSGLLACVALALYLGMYRTISVPPPADPFFRWFSAIALAGAVIIGGIPYLLALLRDWRIGLFATLMVVTGVLGIYFQPPPEGGGRLLQYVIDVASWSYATPDRAYYMTFTYLAVLSVGLGVWVDSDIQRQQRSLGLTMNFNMYSPINHVCARLVVWVAAFTLALAIVMLQDVLDPASPVHWYVLLQSWTQVILIVLCGFLMMRREDRVLSGWVSLLVFASVFLFINLSPGLSSFERLLIVGAVVLGLSASVGAHSWRNLRQRRASVEQQRRSFTGSLITAAVATLLFTIVWQVCPIGNHWSLVATVAVFFAMLIAVALGMHDYYQTRPQVAIT